MIYLTGHSGAAVQAVAWHYPLGLMAQPTSGYAAQVGEWPVWAADNGCYAQGERFRLDRYLAWLGRLVPHRATCLFAPAPDVVGDMAATLALSLPVLGELRAKGYPAALVAQDGAAPEALPWEAFDVLFIGGTTTWKLSEVVPPLVAEAKRRGQWVHMGRVNSLRRLLAARAIGVDSVDGTFLKWAPDHNVPRMLRWLTALREQPTLPLSPRRGEGRA